MFFIAGITTWPWTLTEPWWQTRRLTRQQTTSQTIMLQRWAEFYSPPNVTLFLYFCSNVKIKTIPEGKHDKRGFTCKINYFTVANVGHHAPRQSYEWRCHRFQMKTISFSKSPDNTLESVHFVPHDVRTDGKVVNKYTMVKIPFSAKLHSQLNPVQVFLLSLLFHCSEEHCFHVSRLSICKYNSIY